MTNPTKADLAAAVAKLTQENAGMRDLLAAVSLAADTVPISKDDEAAEWRRSVRVLSRIKGLASLDDWDGYLVWAAGELRAIAAEPVGYEVWVRAEDSAFAPAGEGGVLFPADAPCSADAATVLAESIKAGTPLLVTDDEDAAVSA